MNLTYKEEQYIRHNITLCVKLMAQEADKQLINFLDLDFDARESKEECNSYIERRENILSMAEEIKADYDKVDTTKINEVRFSEIKRICDSVNTWFKKCNNLQ